MKLLIRNCDGRTAGEWKENQAVDEEELDNVDNHSP